MQSNDTGAYRCVLITMASDGSSPNPRMISLLHTLPGRAAFVDLGAFSDNARFLLCCGLFKDQPYAREQITALCLQVTASHPAIFRINFNTYAVAVVLEGSVDRFDLD